MRDEVDFRSDLPDLSGTSLEELSGLGGTVLAEEIERVLAPGRRPPAVSANFSAYLGDE
ncbi:FxSxx-COOH cyclophane-containing RiPP peptide [Actinomadura rupiterrae]|uniref:FxSxx-COOH cyclophane-containing RiPP peptide n=1 Tax=Actinomadura rupiterrae TaxID=559627 RepID=UPI0020A593B1|nr:FxSxx-COOH cyclophane-containing RiPP peptide [Actinomadura rupiterrae]MCP2335037.1 FXSXX-COOH protein [Actinomadura rupiterrae]